MNSVNKLAQNILVAAVISLGLTTLVQASDEIDESKVPEVQVSAPSTTGWYLRGDVGYSWNQFRHANVTCDTCASDFDQRFDGDLKGSFQVGGGLGYQVTDYFRTDLTVDYLTRSKFDDDVYSTKMSALSVLANAYVDLGNLGGVTPYVGAGLGAAHVDWNDVTNNVTGANWSGESDWRFSYALMAGVSVDLTHNLKLDAGYRFQHINGGDMFSSASVNGQDKGMNLHGVRVGLRYMFGG